MKIEWTKTGGSVVTLGDDTASPRNTIRIGAWGGSAQIQQEPLLGSTHPFVCPRGNVAGSFSFAATKSHATLDAAVEAFFNEFARCGEQGELKITTTTKVITYTLATLQSVRRGDKDGVRLEIAYDFLIRSGTIV